MDKVESKLFSLVYRAAHDLILAFLPGLISHHSYAPLHFHHLSILPKLISRWSSSHFYAVVPVGTSAWNAFPSEIPINPSSFFKVLPCPAPLGRLIVPIFVHTWPLFIL